MHQSYTIHLYSTIIFQYPSDHFMYPSYIVPKKLLFKDTNQTIYEYRHIHHKYIVIATITYLIAFLHKKQQQLQSYTH